MPRRRPLFDPALPFPLRVSRRLVELYHDCPRCFYNEVRRGIKRPSLPAFTLNKAVDTLLKREFDQYREMHVPHPTFTSAGVHAIPYNGTELPEWQAVMKGVRVFLPSYNIEATGALDDVVMLPDKTLAVVDYKATSKKSAVAGQALAGVYADSYARQLSWYTFLLKELGYAVASVGYLFIANAEKEERTDFSATLSFQLHLVPLPITSDWIAPCLEGINSVAAASQAPESGEKCEHCTFVAKCTVDS